MAFGSKAALNCIGVYVIVNTADGHDTAYIGSTVESFRRRWSNHKSQLCGGRHGNHHLQRAWDKYGKGAFQFLILEAVESHARATDREQYWLDWYRNNGLPIYNTGEVARCPMLGRKHSAKTKAKMSRARKGRKRAPFSDQWKANISKARSKSWPAFRHEETGEVIPAGLALVAMCDARGLDPGHMRKVAYQQVGHHKGWVLDGGTQWQHGKAKPYPALCNMATGEMIPAGNNLRKLCRERGLDQSHLGKVVRGQIKSHRGWSIIDGIR